MAVVCPKCKKQYDITLFQFGRSLNCECGYVINLNKYNFTKLNIRAVEEREPVELPIDGILDLHTFQSRQVKPLILGYLLECQRRGIYKVRIIHGKGLGILQRKVHSVLRKMPEVVSFKVAGEGEGGWGATIVVLRPPEKSVSQGIEG